MVFKATGPGDVTWGMYVDGDKEMSENRTWGHSKV